MAGSSCDCCNRERPVQVVASPIGPVSLAYCQECLSEGAEPEWTVKYLWVDVANRDWGQISPECVAGTRVFKDGRYQTLEEWSEKYGG